MENIVSYNNGKYIGVLVTYIQNKKTVTREIISDYNGNPVPSNVLLRRDPINAIYKFGCCNLFCEDPAWVTAAARCWVTSTGDVWLLP